MFAGVCPLDSCVVKMSVYAEDWQDVEAGGCLLEQEAENSR